MPDFLCFSSVPRRSSTAQFCCLWFPHGPAGSQYLWFCARSSANNNNNLNPFYFNHNREETKGSSLIKPAS